MSTTKPIPIDVWSDPRVEHKTASVNGQTYKYLLGIPKDGVVRKTVFLVRHISTILLSVTFIHG